MLEQLRQWYDFSGQVAVVTGGTGVLLAPAVQALGQLGAALVILSTRKERAQARVDQLAQAGIQAVPVQADVTDKARLEVVGKQVLDRFGRIDILINGAGGNNPRATVQTGASFFDLPEDAVRQVFDANFMGSLFCAQVFGRPMAASGRGSILNVASMASLRPLTRIVSYSAAKGALTNFTQWLAVHMAQNYSPQIRVNAIAPGFLITEQNRSLLTDTETGQPSPRGKAVLEHTPMARFGSPDEMTGAILWLLSPAAQFVTGVVLPLDGGFSAFSGV